MAGSTLNRGYPYPTGTDANDVPYRMQALAEAIDADVEALSNEGLSGRFTMATQYNKATGTFGTVPYSSFTSDTAGAFTLSAGVVTVNYPGLYIINTHTVWAANATGRRVAAVTVNGTESTNTVSSATVQAVSGGETVQETTKTIFLSEGYTIQVRVFQDSGATVGIIPGVTTNYLGQTALEITRMYIG